jgi:hypothetical protein
MNEVNSSLIQQITQVDVVLSIQYGQHQRRNLAKTPKTAFPKIGKFESFQN